MGWGGEDSVGWVIKNFVLKMLSLRCIRDILEDRLSICIYVFGIRGVIWVGDINLWVIYYIGKKCEVLGKE